MTSVETSSLPALGQGFTIMLLEFRPVKKSHLSF